MPTSLWLELFCARPGDLFPGHTLQRDQRLPVAGPGAGNGGVPITPPRLHRRHTSGGARRHAARLGDGPCGQTDHDRPAGHDTQGLSKGQQQDFLTDACPNRFFLLMKE